MRPWLALCCVVVWVSLVAAPAAAAPPEVEISPNSLQETNRPMTITVRGSAGQQVWLHYLGDCDRDPSRPDTADTCPRPLPKERLQLDEHGLSERTVYFQNLGESFRKQRLWVRVSLDPEGRREYREVDFTVVEALCGIWKTFAALDLAIAPGGVEE